MTRDNKYTKNGGTRATTQEPQGKYDSGGHYVNHPNLQLDGYFL